MAAKVIISGPTTGQNNDVIYSFDPATTSAADIELAHAFLTFAILVGSKLFAGGVSPKGSVTKDANKKVTNCKGTVVVAVKQQDAFEDWVRNIKTNATQEQTLNPVVKVPLSKGNVVMKAAAGKGGKGVWG